ncbi:MAG: GNAT family N-acetyltransferase [Pseudomonadota bacterium]|nr:GNAT family N-acetyltransferase [Pseudomonadota bacterium]
MPPSLSWSLLEFHDLELQQLYDILQLRAEVFINEQRAVYADPDGEDQKALHLLGYDGDRLVAYSRLFAPGVKRKEAVLGRLCVARSHRGKGLGRTMIEKRLDWLRSHHPGCSAWTSLQLYRQPAYEKMGFRAISDVYAYDGEHIPHINMLLEQV